MDNSIVSSFNQKNKEHGLRVFVAGGSRSGSSERYVQEAYKLGRKIMEMDIKLDFGFGDQGIMGAVAKGVLDAFDLKEKKAPIAAITTQEYLDLYPNNEILDKMSEIIVAKTLEERKQKLLDADFVVFAPGGVGTLDELAYDCVAMQDGLLNVKPFVFYNIDGFFYHLLEFLKDISATQFADPIPFIVVENSQEAGVVFSLLKLKYSNPKDKKDAYSYSRQVMYELPYFMKKIKEGTINEQDLVAKMQNVSVYGSAKDRSDLADEVENAFKEKELSRLNQRLKKSQRSAAEIEDKINNL